MSGFVYKSTIHGGETVTGNPTRHKEDLGRTLIYIDLFYIMNVDPSN